MCAEIAISQRASEGISMSICCHQSWSETKESRDPAFGATLVHPPGRSLAAPPSLKLGPGFDRPRDESKQNPPCKTTVMVRSLHGGRRGMRWVMPGHDICPRERGDPLLVETREGLTCVCTWHWSRSRDWSARTRSRDGFRGDDGGLGLWYMYLILLWYLSRRRLA